MFNPQARWDRPLPRDKDMDAEPVEVTVLFKPGRFLPTAFSLHGNDHCIKRIEFVWKDKKGQNLFYLFSVTDTSNNSYTLCFNRQGLIWKLIS